jgi:hypothetical protein
MSDWVKKVVEAFGGYKRERPRDPQEARLLRERGTPEELIGPSRPFPTSATKPVEIKR